MRRLFVLVFAVLSLCSCTHGAREVLFQAEKLLDSCPDSALSVLQSLPEEQLKTRSLYARRDLLLAIAKDKGYQYLETADIQASYEYYSRFGSKRSRMLSAYYLGVAKQQVGEDIEACVLFREAERLAEQQEDYHYLGLSCEHLSTIYAQNYDNEEYVAAARKAVSSFGMAGEDRSANYSRLDVAHSLFYMMRYDEAEKIADSLLVQVSDADPLLLYSTHLLKADISFQKNDPLLAESYYEKAKAIGGTLDIIRLRNVAILKERKGLQKEVNDILSQMWSGDLSPVDSAAVHDCEQHIAIMRGNHKKAYDEVLFVNQIQDRILRAKLDRSITHAQKSYYEDHYKLEQKRRETLIYFFALAILFLTTLLFIALFALLRRKKQIILEMAKVNDLTNDLRRIEQTHRGHGAVIDTLLRDKIKTMQALSSTYFSWTDDAFAEQEENQGKFSKEEVISLFRKHLRKLRNDDKFIPSLEKALDASSLDLMSRLRNQFSGPATNSRLKERDFQMLTLMFAGFSSKSIGFIMDSTDDAVRARKNRYKKFFLTLGEAGEEYARLLS